jgi:hypothetical protein
MRLWVWTRSVAPFLLAACGGSTIGDAGVVATGGATATGGAAGTGGTAPVAGASGAGATGGAGGTVQAGPSAGAGGNDAGTSFDGAGGCSQAWWTSAPGGAQILLVVDESATMADTPAGFSANKWSAVRTALSAALAPLSGGLSLGLELYPFDPTAPIPSICGVSCCQMPTGPAAINVAIQPGANALPKILGALDSASPGGGRPAAAALREALAYFTTGAGAALVGDKYVLFLTDGAPNCCDPDGGTAACLDDTETTAEITALKNASVFTLIMGIPGSEKYAATLDAFAVAGGRTNPNAPPQYYAVDAGGDVAGLTNVLGSIATKLQSCDLQLTINPPDATLLSVAINGAIIPKAASLLAPEGWLLDQTKNPPMIRLVGASCQKLHSEGTQGVQVTGDCKGPPAFY